MKNAQETDIGYLATETPGHFLHLSVHYRAKRGYFVTVNAVELEISDSGFAVTKFGCFDGGLQSFKYEDATRFSAKRLWDIALDISTSLHQKNPNDNLTAAIVKSCSAKGLVVAKYEGGPLSRAAAFEKAVPVHA